MARPDPQFKLRMPDDLKEWIGAEARASSRSLNAEIIFRLRRTRWLDDPQSRPPEWRNGVPAAGQSLQS